MVVVSRFRWFGWFVLCVAVILGCYLMSSRVAAERNKLGQIEKAIASTQREIKALETEFDTRASFDQLQRWNGDTLKLAAPTAAQYVRDDAQLADLNWDGRAGDMKDAVIPSAPVVPAAAPAPQTAATTTSPPAPAPVKAAVAMVSAPAPARIQPAAAKPPAKPKPATVALLDRKLLSGTTLASLNRGARVEGAR